MQCSTWRLIALCLGSLALAACSRDADPDGAPAPPPEVGVVVVRPQDLPLTKDLVGRLSSFRNADVRARVSGVLLQRVYTEGSDVKKGQLLFQIDPAPYQAALEAAQAALAAAEATYTNAHVVANRDRELITKGYISKAQRDSDEATERASKAAVLQAKANMQTALVNLGYTKVTAPIAGRANQQQVTEGATVGASNLDTGSTSTLLTTIDQLDPLYVNFNLSATELEKLRNAQTQGHARLAGDNAGSVQVFLPGGAAYPEAGHIDFTGMTVDPSTGTINLRATIPNPARSLLPGMYVTLKARLGEQRQVFLVPQEGVLRDTAGPYVMVVNKDDKVQRKSVNLASMQGGDWVVDNGLSTGERIVVSGVQRVKDGAPAKATPWQPEAVHTPGAGTQAAVTAVH